MNQINQFSVWKVMEKKTQNLYNKFEILAIEWCWTLIFRFWYRIYVIEVLILILAHPKRLNFDFIRIPFTLVPFDELILNCKYRISIISIIMWLPIKAKGAGRRNFCDHDKSSHQIKLHLFNKIQTKTEYLERKKIQMIYI